jgi:hypothetical protein
MTFDKAVRYGAGNNTPLVFICECGDLRCKEQIELPVDQFDPLSPAGSIVAHVSDDCESDHRPPPALGSCAPPARVAASGDCGEAEF